MLFRNINVYYNKKKVFPSDIMFKMFNSKVIFKSIMGSDDT